MSIGREYKGKISPSWDTILTFRKSLNFPSTLGIIWKEKEISLRVFKLDIILSVDPKGSNISVK
ncbi:hypothetical protein [Hippea jasoniae]|uniref:hypothetical protein n=1 Tax=Hippea jasoniae TaxID=944479 RepID=UPI000554F06A|nr:hypothetical protein [Hippea jasoniae]